MAEPNSGYDHASKIPDFLTAMVASSYNLHDAGLNLSQLQDQKPLHRWTNHGPALNPQNTKIGQSFYTSESLPHRASFSGSRDGLSAYQPYFALSQCLPPDPPRPDRGFLGTFFPGHLDPSDSTFGRCSTPDIVQVALQQLDAQDVSPIGKMDAVVSCAVSPPALASPLDSPSTWTSPGGREYMDSGYISEDSLPTCVYQAKPSHMINTSTNKIPAFAPTFFPIVSRKSSSQVDDQKVQNVFNVAKVNKIEAGYCPKKLLAGPVLQNLMDTNYEPISPVQVAQVTSEILPQPQVKGSKTHLQSALVSTSEDKRQPCGVGESRSFKRKHSESNMADGHGTCSNNSKRGRHNEPLQQKAILFMTEWYDAHKDNPYPSKDEKSKMAAQGGINVAQVKSWFANKRNRSNNTRPKVQKQQLQDRLLTLCHTLSKDRQQHMDNSFVIQQLSTLISTSR